MDSQKRNLRKYLSWTPGVAAIAKIMRKAPISSGYQETLFRKDETTGTRESGWRMSWRLEIGQSTFLEFMVCTFL